MGILKRHLPVAVLAVCLAVGLQGQMPTAEVRFDLASKVAKPGAVLKGTVTVSIPPNHHAYATPTTEEGQIPLSVEFVETGFVQLKKLDYPKGVMKVYEGFGDHPLNSYEGTIKIPVEFDIATNAPAEVELRLRVRTQLCTNDGSCFPPQTKEVAQRLKVETPLVAQPESPKPPTGEIKPLPPGTAEPVPGPPNAAPADGSQPSQTDGTVATQGEPGGSQPTEPVEALSYRSRATERPVDAPAPATHRDSTLIVLLVTAFLAGLALNLTPCVYPLIPITLSFFSNQAKQSTAGKFGLGLLYAFGIAISFGLFGVISVLLGKGFGTLFQSPWFNLFLFLLLTALALSMFGLYEIGLPAFLQRQLKGRSGPVGAFTMGSLLGIGAAPCGTALLAALAIAVAERQDFVLGLAVFTTIGLGVGLPYVFLAIVGAQLPKSADWLISVKRILGLAVIMFAVTRYLGPALSVFPGVKSSSHSVAWTNAGAFFLGAAYLAFFDRSFSSKVVAALRTVSILALAYLGTMNYVEATQPPPKVEWEPFTIAAFESAVGKGKPVVVDGTADWCTACQEIEHSTFRDERVIRAMQKVRAFRMDLSTGTPEEFTAATKEHFGWVTLPHIRFYNSKGELVHIQSEYINADDWLNVLEKAGVDVGQGS